MHLFSSTLHGYQRARERVGWTPAATLRMLDRVFFTGLDEQSAPRAIQRFIARKVEEPATIVAKIFAEQLFIFRNTGPQSYLLVTVYPLPPDLRRVIRGQSRFAARSA